MADKRRYGLTEFCVTYVQQNAGRTLTIDELMQNHPAGTQLNRGQISGTMNNLTRGKIPGLVRGKIRGTWVFNPVAAANQTEPSRRFEPALIDVLPTDQPDSFIGVDKENARVYRMERIA